MESWHPITYLAAICSHWMALVSGVLGFLVSLWFAYKGKTLPFRSLAAFAVLCIALAMYQAWDDEYTKTEGSVILYLSWPTAENALKSEITVSLVADNHLPDDLIINDIQFVRLSIQHDLQRGAYLANDKCFDEGLPMWWKIKDGKTNSLTMAFTTLMTADLSEVAVSAGKSKSENIPSALRFLSFSRFCIWVAIHPYPIPQLCLRGDDCLSHPP